MPMEISHVFIVIGTFVISLLALWSSGRNKKQMQEQKAAVLRRRKRRR